MTALKGLWDRAVAFVLEPSRYVCTVCGGTATEASICEACGVVACPKCSDPDACPYCGEPF